MTEELDFLDTLNTRYQKLCNRNEELLEEILLMEKVIDLLTWIYKHHRYVLESYNNPLIKAARVRNPKESSLKLD